MEISDLSLFITIADTLHFGRAATRCCLSPSALTRAVQRLEEEVGKPLFLRDTRSVKLTEIGKRFLLYAEKTTSEWRQFKAEIDDRTHLTGTLSLYGSVTAVYSIIAQILHPFRSNNPMVSVTLTTGDAADGVQQVVEGRADFAVVGRPEPLPKGISFHPLVMTPLLCIAPVAQSGMVQFTSEREILWQETPVILSERGIWRERLDSWFADRHITPSVYAQVAGNEAIIAMVGLGFGVGVVPEMVLAESPFRSEVRVVEMVPPLEPLAIGAVYRSRRANEPVMERFLVAMQNS